jgi:hypothetical protein
VANSRGLLVAPAAAEGPEQHQEQVHEVEVQRQGAHQGQLGAGRAGQVVAGGQLLQLGSVLGGQAGEDQDAGKSGQPVRSGAFQEEAHDRGQHHADQSHGHKAADADNGVHTAQSDAPFGLTVWGWDFAVSYAYPAGMSVRKINKVVVIP